MLAMYDSKQRTTDTQNYDARRDGSGNSSKKRDWNLQSHETNQEISNHRKYMRTHSSTNNRVSSSLFSSEQQRENNERKSTKDAKKPLRVSGDWSEFKSSTGKTYFYNCKTEVSQWEKPKGWLVDESDRSSSSATNRIAKESAAKTSSTTHARCKMEGEPACEKKLPQTLNVKLISDNVTNHQNGNYTQQDSMPSKEQLPVLLDSRLPGSDDDSSRMSFSSTSSKDSSSVALHKNEHNDITSHLPSPKSNNVPPNSSCDNPSKPMLNGNMNKTLTKLSTMNALAHIEIQTATETESMSSSVSKAERDQDIQKFYRAELIQHLTGWHSNQLEKQCFKLFDDYYGYSTKTSAAFAELKGLKSNFRVLDIKRNILTRRLLSCQKHMKQCEEERQL